MTSTRVIERRPALSISGLPREILAEIFCLCVPEMTSESARMSIRNAPLLLCRVCSPWREIALTTPMIWTTVGIVICRWQNWDVWAAPRIINAWLQRSGALPLTLRLDYNPYHCRSCAKDPSRVELELIDAILIVFSFHSPRWQDVTLSFYGTPPVSWPQLGNLPLLRTLHLHGRSHTAVNLMFSRSPNLTRLSGPYPFFGLPNPHDHISHLCISTRISIFDASEAIRLCPRLEEFQASPYSSGPDSRLPRSPTVENHSLRTLMITSRHFRLLFNSLTLPSLREVSLNIGDPDDTSYFEFPGFLDFLTRSGCKLDTIRLKNWTLSEAMVLVLLEHRSLDTVQVLTINNSYNHRMFTEDVLIRLTNPPIAESRVLLPNLTRLTLGKCIAHDVSPSTLGRMIHSRRCSWDEYGTEQLTFLSLITPGIDLFHDPWLREAISDGLVANNITSWLSIPHWM